MTDLIKIYAMPTEVKNVIESAQHRAYSFYKHATYIMANPKSGSVGWWTKELYGMSEWLQDVTFKHNKKKVTKDFVKKYLLDEYGHDDLYTFSKSLDRSFSYLKNNKNKKRDNSKDELLFNNYKLFCDEVANAIDSKQMEISKMRELVEKYLII